MAERSWHDCTVTAAAGCGVEDVAGTAEGTDHYTAEKSSSPKQEVVMGQANGIPESKGKAKKMDLLTPESR